MSPSKKVYYGLIAVITLLCLLLVGGAKLTIEHLKNKSNDLIAIQLKQDKLNEELSQLDRAEKEILAYGPLAKIAKSIVPQDKNQAEAVREIIKMADRSNILIGEISYPESDLGNATAPKSNNVNLSQLTQVKGMSGVYQLPLSIKSAAPVSYSQLIQFLDLLEHNRRTAQVSNIDLTPDPKAPGVLSFSLSVIEYIHP